MEIKKIPFRKSMKFLTLLLTSLLIAMASAQVYRYMYITGSITIGTEKLIWIKGADAPADASISGSTATIDLDVEPGTPINFTECLFLKNDNAIGSFNILISITTAVSSSDFDEAKTHIYQNSTGEWQYVDSLDLTNAASSYSGSLAAGEYLRMTFEVAAKASASGTMPFGVQVRYD